MPEDRATSARPFVAGVNHRTSSLGLRDRMFLEEDALPDVLDRLRAAGLDEAVVLSTCDRVEVVGAAAVAEAAADAALAVLAEATDVPLAELEGQANRLVDAAAVRHVFNIAASLASLVIGEPQVLGQVKSSHRISRETGMPAGTLDTLLQAAYAAAKRVRTETGIGEGPVSIAAVATMMVKELHGDLRDVTALLVGGGEMGELVAGDMRAAGLAHLTVMHPRERRAMRLAEMLGCPYRPYDELAALLPETDVIVTSLGSGHRIITAEMIAQALKKRRHRPMFLVDTAVPGDVEPAVHELEDAFVYDLGDLERIAMEGLAGRGVEAEAARAIIAEEVETFLSGRRERVAGPLVSGLRARFEETRQAALAEAGGDAEKATRLLINRLLHGPSTRLRKAAAAADMDLAAAERLLEQLFQPDSGNGDNEDDANNDDIEGTGA